MSTSVSRVRDSRSGNAHVLWRVRVDQGTRRDLPGLLRYSGVRAGISKGTEDREETMPLPVALWNTKDVNASISCSRNATSGKNRNTRARTPHQDRALIMYASMNLSVSSFLPSKDDFNLSKCARCSSFVAVLLI